MERNGGTLRKLTGTRRPLQWMGVGALFFALYPACGDGSTEERLRAARLAESCSLDSECKRTDPKLVCKFGYCHQECEGDEDCRQYRGRCVQPGICQLEDEISCVGGASKCTEDGRTQVCADDGECRDECTKKADCISGLECSVSGYCARPRELDEDGELLGSTDASSGVGGAGGSSTTTVGSGGSASVGGSDGSGGSGGSSDSGGSGGTGGVENTGGSGATGGTGGAGGTSGAGGSGGNGTGGNGGSGTGGTGGTGGSGGAGGTGGEGGSGGTGGEGGSGGTGGAGGTATGGTGGDPEITEEEPNDDVDEPNPLPLDGEVRAVVGSTTDIDYFAVTVPEGEKAGGYFQLSLVDVGHCLLRYYVWPLDHSGYFLTQFSSSPGASLYGYFAAATDQQYLIEVKRSSGSGFPCPYTIAARFESVDDPFEPNDKRGDATLLELDESIEAFLFAGYTSSSILQSAFDDWYEIELAEGSVSVQLSDIPESVSTRVLLYGPPDGALLTQKNSNEGTPENNLTYEVTEAGTYYLQVGYFGPVPVTRHGSTMIPEHFVNPYTLLVTQTP